MVSQGRRPVVSHSGHADENVLRADALHHRLIHFLRAGDVDPRDAGRCRLADRAADERHLGTGIAGRTGEGKTHLAAGEVGDAAYRIDRLEGRAGSEQYLLAGEQLGLEVGDHRIENVLGFEHAPFADFATGLFAAGWAEDRDAIAAQRGDIALRRRFAPHLAVHRRGDEQRAVARQRQRCQQVVGDAVCHLGQIVGRGGGDEQQVGLARQVDVRHAVAALRVPRIGEDVLAGERLEGQRRNEVHRRVGHRYLHRSALLDEQAHQFRRLVCRNAAGDAEGDALAFQFHTDNPGRR